MKKYLIGILSILSASLALQALACTDFRLQANDGSILITRSMEFAMDLQSSIRTQPRGKQFSTTAPDGKLGLGWISKYGYVYLDGFGIDRVVDGVNEKGLSFEALYMPGEAQYQSVPQGKDNQAMPYLEIGGWLLGNFHTIDEVRSALANVYVCTEKLPGLGDTVFPLHYAIYDATGKGIIVEYTSAGMHIYDNVVGILTNSPTYDWHIINLRNYLYLSPYAPDPIVAGNLVFASMGQGSGSIGLPGDISPPSRFVKIAFLKQTAVPTADMNHTLNLAEHLINNVDIPLGSVRAKQQSGQDVMEYTQWVVFKDLTHHMFYYRTYGDPTLRGIAMDKLDFSPQAARLKMPLNIQPMIVDETSQFLQQKGS